jgi:CO/xanthine dehydrogenase Mo-binding subunit
MRRTRDLDTCPEPERYEQDEGRRYFFDLSRRSFFGITGAGLLIVASHEAMQGQARSQRDTIAARLHIAKDGKITLMTSKVEVGQGSRTQLAQAAAEELQVPVERIDLLMADTAQVPDDGGTAGSRTTPSTVPAVRKGAAAAREVLIKLAREQWSVEGFLKVEDGKITDPATGRTLSYADLAGLVDLPKSLDQAIPADVKLYPVDQWTVLGTSPQKANARNIVTGSHRYPSDVVRPNMLYGKVLRAPSYGAVLTDVDLSAAQKLPGVTVVRDGNFAGCVAGTSFQAQKVLDVLSSKASWKIVPHPSSKELFTYLKHKAATDESGARKPRVRSKGSLQEGLAAAKQTVSASYEIAYIQHAPMEPRASVAEWQEGLLTVWTGTQQPQRVRRDLADAFHLPEDRVRVIVPDTGGGFGGKHTGEVAVEAARLAKGAGRPVSLRWTREEEFTWAYFRPAGLIEAQAGLAADGHLLVWDFSNFNSGASALESPYEIPHTRERFCYSEPPLREGSYRALAATANTFARESFMDELAAAAKADTLEYRLAHLKNERLRAVLQAAAERFGWHDARNNTSPATGVGLACGTEKGSYTAACAQVAVDRERGTIKVLRVVEAFECGAIQNPANLRAQVEGCIIMTLGGTLSEEIQFENGRLLNGRFSQYPVPRFKDVPPIETVLLNRRDLPSVGAGETPMIAVPPAVANAVFDACTVRVRSMPIRGSALKS